MTAKSITCPRCGRTSWNPNDVREGYCGACHDWTGREGASISLDDAARALGIDPASIPPVDAEEFRSWQTPEPGREQAVLLPKATALIVWLDAFSESIDLMRRYVEQTPVGKVSADDVVRVEDSADLVLSALRRTMDDIGITP